MFFNGWDSLFRVAVSACAAYLVLVLFIRVSGKRTLTQLNAFDFVVTVALGSMLATIILSKSVALIEGLLALGMLVLLQYVVAWASMRSEWFSKLVKSEPRLLFHNGRFLDHALRRERIRHEEIRQILRNQGIASLETVAAIVLETNGKFSVIEQSGERTVSTPEDIDSP